MFRTLMLVVLVSSLILVVTGCKKKNDEPAFDLSSLPAERDVENGRRLFENGSGSAVACSTCHSLDGFDRSTAPSLQGFASHADSRVEGESAELYALNSIIAPGKYIVDGFNNTMTSSYEEKLSRQQIADLIAFLLTLE